MLFSILGYYLGLFMRGMQSHAHTPTHTHAKVYRRVINHVPK